MGAELDYRTYSAHLTRAELETQWALDVEQSRDESGHECSGRIGMLDKDIPDWHDAELESELLAKHWLQSDDHRTDQVYAVSFKAMSGKKWLIGGWCNG